MVARNLLKDQNVSSNTPRNVLRDPIQREDNQIISEGEKSILQRIQQNITSPKTRSISNTPFGISLAAIGVPEEDALPAIFGTAGAIIGARAGRPHLGVGLGTGAGKLAKDTIKKFARGGDDIDVTDAVIIGGLSAAGSKFLDVAFKSAGVAFKIIPEKSRAKLFEKALQAVNIGRKAINRNFQRSITQLVEANPKKRIDLSIPIKNLMEQFEGIDETLIPQLKTAVKNNKILKDAVDNPLKRFGLTLKDAQELKNSVTSATQSITRKAIRGKTTPNERIVFEIIDQFDDAITSAFPEMASVRRAFKMGRKAFDLARPLVEPGVPVESSIFSKPQGLFGAGGTPFMKSVQGKLAFQKITGMTEAGQRLFATAELAHRLNRVADFISRVGQITVGGAILKKITGSSDRFQE